jgi:hypothetical protein
MLLDNGKLRPVCISGMLYREIRLYLSDSLCKGISREEATVLGSQRREELRRLHDRDSTVIGRVKTLLQVSNEHRSIECLQMTE